MNKKLCLCFLVILPILLYPPRAFAEYNSEKIGNAVGIYLMTIDLLERISNSQCGYIIKKEYSFKKELDEVIKYLSEPDKKELKSILESEDFKDDIEKNSLFIRKFMDKQEFEGLDEKTLCGILYCTVIMHYYDAKNNWDDVKKTYSTPQSSTDMKEIDYANWFEELKKSSKYFYEKERLEDELYRMERQGKKDPQQYKKLQYEIKLNEKNYQEWSRLLSEKEKIQDHKSEEYRNIQRKIEVLESVLKMK